MDTTTPGTPGGTTADYVNAAPLWVTIVLVAVVGIIVAAMFLLTLYNMSAPRSTLKNLLGVSGVWKRKSQDLRPADEAGTMSTPIGRMASDLKDAGTTLPPKLITALALSARVNTRTTRTTLAITGFALLGVIVVVVFALSGQGVRDLRTQVVAGVVTLVATIAGFYFGSQTAADSAGVAGSSAGKTVLPASSAPTLQKDPDPTHAKFTVGTPGAYSPKVSGDPAPRVGIIGTLPMGLAIDPGTGELSGSPTGTGDFNLTVVADNGIQPPAALTISITVVE